VEIVAEKIFIRFFLKDVADGFEFRKHGEAFEMGADGFIDQRHPADDGLDAVGLVGEGEQEIGFLDDLAGLDHYGSFDSGLGSDRLKFGCELVLGKWRADGDPWVILLRVAPEMMMGIDHGDIVFLWRCNIERVVFPDAMSLFEILFVALSNGSEMLGVFAVFFLSVASVACAVVLAGSAPMTSTTFPRAPTTPSVSSEPD